MMLYICKMFLCFILFSCLGWCLEVLYGLLKCKRFVNRGFLIGPLCPIYGVGCVLLYLLLSKYASDPIVLFILAMVICSILEYLVSYLMEKIFKTRWWDYSMRKFNINGRICLETIIPFGILGLLVVYILFPNAMNLLSMLPPLAIYISSGIILLLFIIDLTVSFNIIMKFKESALRVPKDMTEEITKFVKNTLSKRILTKRLINSFPDLQIDLSAIKDKIFKSK